MARNITDEDVKAVVDAVFAQAASKAELVEEIATAVAAKIGTLPQVVKADVVAMGGVKLDPADPTTMPVTRFK